MNCTSVGFSAVTHEAALEQLVPRATKLIRIADAELPLAATKFTPRTASGKASTSPAMVLDGRTASIAGPLEIAEGAAYVAVAVPAIVPTVELPPAIPFTLQVTPVLAVPETLAVNTCAPLDGTLAIEGETVIATLLSRFTVAEPLICGSASLTPRTRTFAGVGSTEGAV
jgi:hypothetical protein